MFTPRTKLLAFFFLTLQYCNRQNTKKQIYKNRERHFFGGRPEADFTNIKLAAFAPVDLHKSYWRTA
jgi:hypothetical protein